MEALRSDAELWPGLVELQPQPAPRGDVQACHTPRHYNLVERAVSEGLGYLIMNARRLLAAPDIIVGMLTIGLLGLVFDRFFRQVERRLYARLG